MMYQSHSFAGPLLVFAVWIVQLFVAFLIYRDAKEQKMLAPVWTILAILPMFGYLVDVLYLIIRELRSPKKTDAATIS
nr:hypothetical protein [uncultured Methanoregula sp.]